MTDDELQQRLRRWARPGAEPDWDSMAAGVRAAFEAEMQRSEVGAPSDATVEGAGRRRARRRRWMAAPVAGALALAAALTLWVRLHHAPRMSPLEDEAVMMDEADPDELIDELTPAQLDRVAQALKKGA